MTMLTGIAAFALMIAICLAAAVIGGLIAHIVASRP
jgi:hypothetical protein